MDLYKKLLDGEEKINLKSIGQKQEEIGYKEARSKAKSFTSLFINLTCMLYYM